MIFHVSLLGYIVYNAFKVFYAYFYLTQILMNVRQTTHVMSMQTVMILMAATGVSAGQDSWEMDTTAQVCT